jgi:hypothetical protein
MRNNKDEPVGAGTMKLEIDCKEPVNSFTDLYVLVKDPNFL